MPPHKQQAIRPPARALIRMPNWLGDCVMALPVIESLKAAFSECLIDIAIKESLAGLGELLSSVNKTISLPENDAPKRRAVLAQARDGGYDLLLTLPNSFRSTWDLWTSKIPVRAGYTGSFRSFTLTHAIKRPAKHSMSQADYFFRLAKSVYAELEVEKPKLSIPRGAFLKSESLLPPEKRPAIGVGFGAEYGSAKMWPAERFAELIDRLESMARIVLIGTDSDREMAAKVFALAKSSPLSLVGKTDLPTLAATLKRLALYITNDTGPMHLAAAAGTPVLAIFGPTSPEETGPAGGNHILIYHGADCAPCWKRRCPTDHRCMTAITVDEVADAALEAIQ